MHHGVRTTLLTLALGVAGGALFAALHLPLPWLLGAVVFNMIGSFAGLRLGLSTYVRTPALTVLGVTIGSALTPDLVGRAQDWWLTLAAMALFVVTASPLAIVYCRKVMGFDMVSATYAGIPGGLSEMIFTGSALGGDPRRIALAHASRLALILLLLPPVMKLVAGIDIASARPGFSPWAMIPPLDAVLLLGCAVLGAFAARLVRLPNPFLLGPLILSGAVHLLSLTTATPPNWLLDVIQLVVGAYVGAQFANTRATDLLRILTLSSILTSLLLGLAGLFAWTLSQAMGFEFAAVLLAFVPGGIAEMSLIAVLLHIDPIFVAAHHIFRVLLILSFSPMLAIRSRQHQSTHGKSSHG
jgi:membrane AbrB-like protein